MLPVRAAFAFVVVLSACRGYDVVSVQSPDWPARSSEINIGYFDASGSASRASNRNNLYESLSFSLREAEFRTREVQDVFALYARNELPVNRLLTEAEVLRLSGLLPGRILLQGRMEEILTQTLVEDRVQIQVNVNIYSLETGKRLGEIRVYGKDLENVTGSETLAISRLVAKRLREMTGSRTSSARECCAGDELSAQNEIEAEEDVQVQMRARYAVRRVQAESELASRRSAPAVAEASACSQAGSTPPGISSSLFRVVSPVANRASRQSSVRLAAAKVSLHYHSIRNGYAGRSNA